MAVVNVIHHAYFDGAGASHVLQQFFSTEPGVKHVPPEQAWQPDVYPSWFKRLLSGARDWPGVVLANTPRAVVGIFKKLRVEAAARKSGKPPPSQRQHDAKNPAEQGAGARPHICLRFTVPGRFQARRKGLELHHQRCIPELQRRRDAALLTRPGLRFFLTAGGGQPPVPAPAREHGRCGKLRHRRFLLAAYRSRGPGGKAAGQPSLGQRNEGPRQGL